MQRESTCQDASLQLQLLYVLIRPLSLTSFDIWQRISAVKTDSNEGPAHFNDRARNSVVIIDMMLIFYNSIFHDW